MAIDEISRPQYYYRQYLGFEDLTAEQAYHRDMRRRHNLGPHTWGIVAGLELVEQSPSDGGTGVDVVLQPGVAVDGFGRELIVLNSVKLDAKLFANCLGRQHREVWIAYDEQPRRTAADRADPCDPTTRARRVRETFRIVVGPQPSPHDALRIAGQNVSPVGAPVAAGMPVTAPPVVPPDESVPYQEFPGAQLPVQWLVRLGSVLWDADAANPDNTKGRFFPADAGRLLEQRGYVGSVVSEVLAPAGAFTIKHREAPSPLPTDAKDPYYGGVDLQVQGSLSIDRGLTAKQDVTIRGALSVAQKIAVAQDLQIDGRAGIGTATLTGRLNIAGIVQPAQGTLTVFGPDADVIYDGGSDGLFVFKDTGGKTAFLGGSIGIGTDAPTNRLHVSDSTGIRQNRLYVSGGDGWSSLTYNAYHDAKNANWVFPDTSRPVVTIEMDDANGTPRFEVYTTTPANTQGWVRRLRIDGTTGDFFINQQRLVQIFRLYNSQTGDHFYTASAQERDNAVANDGYTYEGVAFSAFV